MTKVMFVGGSAALKSGLEGLRLRSRRSFKFAESDWPAVKRKAVSFSDVDVMIMDLTTPDAYTLRSVTKLHVGHPGMQLVLMTDANLAQKGALTRLLEKPSVDFVRSSADAGEVRHRIGRLLDLRETHRGQGIKTVESNGMRELVPELHDPENGRLDARLVANFFGMRLADIARAIGKSLSAVHKTPSAVSLQAGLFEFERISVALLTLAGSKENARVWINLPEDQFDGSTPISLIRDGRGNLVVELLNDMLSGQPS